MRFPLLIEQNVRGLDVPMQHAPLMRVMHRPSYRCHQTHHPPLPTLHPSTLQRSDALTFPIQVRQRAALHQLHAEIVLALVLADFVDRNDIRMIEIGGRFGFGAETLDFNSRGQLARANHLQRNGPV